MSSGATTDQMVGQKDLARGIAWSSMLYVCMGVFFILVGNVWAMLPLNTPGIYQTVGAAAHINGIRWLTSSMLFAVGAVVLVSGLWYGKNPRDPRVVMYSRIVAIVQQPWIGIAFLVIAGIWLSILFDIDGDLGEAIAGIYGLDVSIEVQKYEFIDIMKAFPSLEFLMFGLGIVLISPMTMYSGSALLQDTGLYLNKKRMVAWQGYDERFRMYAVKGLFTGGIFYAIIGLFIWLIGKVMTIGIDLLYPTISFESYWLLRDVYFWIPVVFGATCMFTAMSYYYWGQNTLFRTLAWYCAIVQLAIPLYGWFFGINLIMNLRKSGENIERRISRREGYLGFSAALFSILVPAFIILMINLNRLNPLSFQFAINWNNLEEQVDGLVWTFTFVLTLFYAIAGGYMFMESRASQIEAQKKFRLGLGILFVMLGALEGMVLLYSILKSVPGIDVRAIFPDTIPAPTAMRGDNGFIFTLAAASMLYITYAIEKYIKQSKRMIVNRLTIIFTAIGSMLLVFMFISAVNTQEWYQIGGYVFVGFDAIGMLFGILFIAIIYGQLAAQTSGEIKKNALTILWGFLITIVAVILHALRSSFEFPFNWVVFIILNIIGVIILMQGMLKSSF
nr:hypothetical protein [Candidatus Sigynarchaeota archaeon]